MNFWQSVLEAKSLPAVCTILTHEGSFLLASLVVTKGIDNVYGIQDIREIIINNISGNLLDHDTGIIDIGTVSFEDGIYLFLR